MYDPDPEPNLERYAARDKKVLLWIVLVVVLVAITLIIW